MKLATRALVAASIVVAMIRRFRKALLVGGGLETGAVLPTAMTRVDTAVRAILRRDSVIMVIPLIGGVAPDQPPWS
jgi:hypothetical protein